MSKHTPGPWNIDIDQTNYSKWPYVYAVRADGFRVLICQCTDVERFDFTSNTFVPTQDEQEIEANARLISSAPDLYSACRAMIEAYSGDPDSPECRLMRDALAKAEGRATSE